jgi:hypothetical protein
MGTNRWDSVQESRGMDRDMDRQTLQPSPKSRGISATQRFSMLYGNANMKVSAVISLEAVEGGKSCFAFFSAKPSL